VPSGNITASSNYFMATIDTDFGGAHARGLALLARDKPDGWPAIVWRKYL
jgi:hypothetical protein